MLFIRTLGSNVRKQIENSSCLFVCCWLKKKIRLFFHLPYAIYFNVCNLFDHGKQIKGGYFIIEATDCEINLLTLDLRNISKYQILK